MRKSGLFPPPSGPMNPKSSPASTSNDTSSSARVPPNCLRRLRALTELDIDRHPELEQPLAVVHANLDGVDEVRTLVARLHRRRRELRLAGDPRHRARQRLPCSGVWLQPLFLADINSHRRRLADLHGCELRFVDVGADVHDREVGNGVQRLSRLNELPGL